MLAGVLVPVLLLLLAIAVFYFRRRYLQRRRESQRELTEEERIEAMLPALQEALEENYGPQARGRIIPLRTMNSNKSFRARLSRTPLYDPIINRRQRQRNASISSISPLTRPSLRSAPSTQTLRRPDSVRTTHTANSVGQRSVSSPLAPISPAMLRNVSHAESFRYYAAEQAQQKEDLETRSRNLANLRRAADRRDGE